MKLIKEWTVFGRFISFDSVSFGFAAMKSPTGVVNFGWSRNFGCTSTLLGDDRRPRISLLVALPSPIVLPSAVAAAHPRRTGRHRKLPVPLSSRRITLPTENGARRR